MLQRLFAKIEDEGTSKRDLHVETLEPRVLYSAAPIDAAPAEGEAEPSSAPVAEHTVVSEDAMQVAADVAANEESSLAGVDLNQEVTVLPEVDNPEVEQDLETVQLLEEDDLGAFQLTSDEPEGGYQMMGEAVEGAELTVEVVEEIAQAAADRWIQTGLNTDQVAALANISYQIEDLSGQYLGAAEGSVITIDVDAAGRDWYVDASPLDDSEFGWGENGRLMIMDDRLQARMDLFTVLSHEQGHILGLEDVRTDPADLMYANLNAGERRLAELGDAANAVAGSVDTVSFMTAATADIFTDTVDSGDGFTSLREAIIAIESIAGDNDDATVDHTITLNAGTYTLGIAGTAEDASATGDLDINNRTVVVEIVGQGAANTTIDAAQIDRVFDIRNGSNVIFRNLTITGGNGNGDGGGIWVDNSDVTLDNVVITGNRTDTTISNPQNSEGGGIYTAGHNTKVTLLGTVEITNNSAYGYGGGAFFTQHTQVDGSGLTAITISGNASGVDGSGSLADRTDRRGGGLVVAEHSQVSLNNATITKNNATDLGGGFWAYGSSSVTLTGTNNITDNNARTDGGGFYLSDAATATIDNLTLSGNTAGTGQGGGFRTAHQAATVTINTGTITNNVAGITDDNGGGGGFWSQGTTNLKDVDITSNTAYGDGGGFYAIGLGSVVNAEDVNVTGNFAEDSGGGFRANTAEVNFTLNANSQTNISNNIIGDNRDGTGAVTGSANDKVGGGFYSSNRSTINIANGFIENNTTTGHGSGFYAIDESTITITDGLIKGNKTSTTQDEHGGGFYVAHISKVTLNNTDVTENTANSRGGGFYVASKGATVELNNSDVTNNVGNSRLVNNVHGGGFYTLGTVKLDTVNISGNTITNTGTNDSHGGGFVTDGAGAFVTGTSVNITGNTAYLHGGGFYGVDGTVDLKGGEISGNVAGATTTEDSRGAGGYLVGEGNTTLTDFTVKDHTTESHGGAFYVTNRHAFILDNSTVTNNRAGVDLANVPVLDGIDGGAIYVTDDARVLIRNGSTISNNIAEDSGGGIEVASVRGFLQIEDSTITGNTAQSGVGGGLDVRGSLLLSGTVNITNNVTTIGDNNGTAETADTANNGGGFYLSGTAAKVLTGTLSGNFTDRGAPTIVGGSIDGLNLTGNTAHGGGAGFFADGNSQVDLRGKTADSINIADNVITATATNAAARGAGFHVAGSSHGSKVRIDNGLITGHSTSREGGGFFADDGTVVELNDVNITKNTAGSHGGGFYVDNAATSVIMNGGTISNNIAAFGDAVADSEPRGGGFRTGGYVSLTDVTVLNNELQYVSGGDYARRGGGIAVDGNAYLNLVRTTVTGNTSPHSGAGIYSEGKLTAVDSHVTKNSFVTPDGKQDSEGAGLHLTGSSWTTWQGGSVSENTGNSSGAGIRLAGGYLSMTGGTVIAKNTMVFDDAETNTNRVGGGLYASGGSQIELNGAIFEDNTALGRGGGIYLVNDVRGNFVDTIIRNNIAGNSTYTGGVFTRGTNPNSGSNLSGESGGLWLSENAQATMTGGEVSGNIGTGGGIEVRNDATLTLDSVDVLNNVSGINQGGGITIEDDATLDIRNGSLIQGNIAYDSDGGGIYTEDRTAVTISDSKIHRNLALESGGFQTNVDRDGAGIYISGSTNLNITGSTISENYAHGRGGGLLHNSSGHVEIVDSIFEGNRTIHAGAANLDRANGGAINIITNNVGSTMAISGSLFKDNISAGDGGALAFWNNGQAATVTNSTFTGNIAGFDVDDATAAVDLSLAADGLATTLISKVAAGVPSDINTWDTSATYWEARNRVGGFAFVRQATTTVDLDHVTITGNLASGNSGGIDAVDAGLASAHNSIIIGNLRDVDDGAGGNAEDTRDDLILSGVNIIGTARGQTAAMDTANHAILGNGTTVFDGSGLADNGGPTMTFAIDAAGAAANGAAVDVSTPAVSDSTATKDQRGNDRRQDGISDIGAFEIAGTVTNAAPTIDTFTVPTTGETGVAINLDATGTAADGGLTFEWLVTDPTGVRTQLLAPNAAAATTFTATQEGTYQFTLIASDADGDATYQEQEASFRTHTTVNVSDQTDGGGSTLRDAIATFNAGGTDMTIVLDTVGNYQFTSSEITINERGRNLTIVGATSNAADTVIEQTIADQLFIISSHTDVTFRNLTITGGAFDGDGGAIQVTDAEVDFDNVILRDNRSGVAGDTAQNDGGAVRASGSSVVTFNDSHLQDNSAEGRGGALYVHEGATVNFTGTSSITGNIIDRTNSNSQHGGGFWADDGAKINISGDFTLSDNHAGAGGGGFHLSDLAQVDGSAATSITISGNNDQTTRNDGDGAGFQAANNTRVTLANVTISENGDRTVGNIVDGGDAAGNDGRSGGGFYATGYSVVSITDGSIKDNFALTVGGGFRAGAGAEVTLQDVTISGNTAETQGGGFFSENLTKVTLTETAANQSKIENNISASHGGGFYTRGEVNITDVDITGNTAGDNNDEHGGGFYALSTKADVNLVDVNLTNNVAEESGGGFYANHRANVSLSLSNNTTIAITGNEVQRDDSQGSIFTAENSAMVVIDASASGKGVDLSGNFFSDTGGGFSGGGFYAGVGTSVSIDTDTAASISGFANDGGDGGGFFAGQHSTVALTNIDITGNTASTEGGGFFGDYYSNVTITDGLISGNKSGGENSTAGNDNEENSGGGLYTHGVVNLVNTNVTNNETLPHASRTNTQFRGGGIFSDTRWGVVTLTDSSVTNNVSRGDGGGVFVRDSEFNIVNTATDKVANPISITGNTIGATDRTGGGLYFDGIAKVSLDGVLIDGNTAFDDGGGFYATSDANVSIDNSTISNNVLGNATAHDGAGFFVTTRAAITIANSVIDNNTATRSGGAFRNESADASVTITNTTISNNTAINNDGGAIHTIGTLSIKDSTFTDNATVDTSPGNDTYDGGAIYHSNSYARTTLTNTDINNHSAYGRGGAVFASGGYFTATDSDFKNNEVLSTSQRGGALWFGGGAIVDVTNSEITGNTATDDGGGISVGDGGTTSGVVMTLDNVKINTNVANSTGGGFWVSDTQSDITIKNSEINGNKNLVGPSTSRDSGGGLFISNAKVVIEDSTVNNNTASADGSAANEREGGGIRIAGAGANVTLTRTTVSGNEGGEGAGIFNQGILTLDDSTVSNNTVTSTVRQGGGIFLDGSAVTHFTNSKITNNVSTHDGGGIYVGGRSVNNWVGVEISNNRTTDDGNNAGRVGGGFRVTGDAIVTVTDSQIDNNTSYGRGGGIYSDGQVTLIDTSVSGNVAERTDNLGDSTGGGIHTRDSNNILNLDRVTVANNRSTGNGGGAYLWSGEANIQNSTFSGNLAGVATDRTTVVTANVDGGGIFLRSGGQDGNYVHLNHVTITDNVMSRRAGFDSVDNARVIVENSIIYGNLTSAGAASDLYDSISLKGTNIIGQQASATLETTEFGGTDLGNVDPVFGTLADNGGSVETHTIGGASPAKDAAVGSNDIFDSGGAALATDARGVARPQGAASDIGAYEASIPNAYDLEFSVDEDGSFTADVWTLLEDTDSLAGLEYSGEGSVGGTVSLDTADPLDGMEVTVTLTGVDQDGNGSDDTYTGTTAVDGSFTIAGIPTNIGVPTAVAYTLAVTANVPAGAAATIAPRGIQAIPKFKNYLNYDPASALTDLSFFDTNATADPLTFDFTHVSGPTGTLAVDAAGSLTFTPYQDLNGTAVYSYTVSNSIGASASQTLTITVAAQNDAPVHTVPSAQTVDEDATLTFAGASLISIADVDVSETAAPNDVVTTVISVSNGALTLSGVTGLTFNNGSTNGSATIDVTGTVADINTALDGMTYLASPTHFSGSDSLTITTNDGGNTGADPGNTGTMTSEEDSDTVAITITPVADAPTLDVDSVTALDQSTVNVTTTEDTTVAIPISAVLVDTDGSETLSVTISAVPVGATLTDGTNNFTATAGTTSIDVTSWTLASLLVTPPANSDSEFSLTVTATATEGSPGNPTTVDTVGTINVQVDAVADPVSLDVDTVNGGDQNTISVSTNEDTAVAIPIAAASGGDADGSESFVVSISDVPVGATLSDGVNSFTATGGTTTIDVSSWTLANLTVTPPNNSDGEFALTVTATATESTPTSTDTTVSGGPSTATATINVQVDAVADAPTLDVDTNTGGDQSTVTVSGDEDTAISLAVAASLVDTDGSETLSIVISGVPTGATLSAGTDNGGGNWSLTAAQLTGLTITPPANSDGEFALTVTATATETAPTSSDTTVTTANADSVGTINVQVNAVADAPTLDLDSVAGGNQNSGVASGDENTAIALDIAGALVDTDGSESLSFIITGVPTGASLSAGTDNGGGSWTLTEAQLSGLTVTPPSNDDTNFNLTVTARATELNPTSSDTTVTTLTADTVGTIAVTVNSVAGTPVVTGASTNEDTQTTSGLVVTPNPADVGSIQSFQITGISGGQLFKGDGTTLINNNDFITTAEGAAGLKFTPTADSDVNGSFQAQASTTADAAGLAGGLATASIIVTAVADTPTVTAPASNGTEDGGAIALSITPNLADTDGSETITAVTISGIPAGAALDNTGNDVPAIVGGSVTLTTAQLVGLNITPASDFFGSFNLSITATATETSNSATANSAAETLTVTVAPVADTPSVTNATTNEDVQSSSGLVITPNANDGASVTGFQITGITGGQLFKADGTTQINENDFITTAEGAAGLKFTPSTNSDANGSFNVQATTDGGATGLGGGLAAAAITVSAVADAPNLDVDSGNGGDQISVNVTTTEDTAVAIGTVASLVDSDSSETLSVNISSVPVGVTLTDGANSFTATAGTTSVDVSSWALASLQVTPPANSDSEFALTITATATESSNADFASTVGTVNVQVDAVADTPTLDVDGGSVVDSSVTVTTNEDTSVAIPVAAALGGDSDGSESLAVSISAIPVGATLTDGTNAFTATAGNTVADVSTWTLSSLTVTPPANSDSEFSLTVTATTTESNPTSSDTTVSGAPAQTTGTINVVVNAVADAPTLDLDSGTGGDQSSGTASGNEDTAISLDIASSLVDTDGSETLAITISGVPTGAVLSAGTDNLDGSWTLTSAQLAGLTITPPTDSDSDFNLTVTATASETTPTSSDTTVSTLSVSAGAGTIAVDVIPQNDLSVIAGTAAGQNITDKATVNPFSGATITDVDVPADTVTVVVTLDDAAKGSLTGAGFTETPAGTYTFNGTASAATTALQGLTFDPTENRVAPGLTETTTFTLSVNDGSGPVTDTTTTVVTTSVNDVATILLTDPADALPLDYTSGSPAAAVLPGGMTITDPDGTPIQSATVQITSGLDPILGGADTTGDTLMATPSGGITAGNITWDPNTGTLTISPGGGASAADMQAVLQSITFESNSADLSNRTVAVTVNDGTANSAPLARTIQLSPPPPAPSGSTGGGVSTPPPPAETPTTPEIPETISDEQTEESGDQAGLTIESERLVGLLNSFQTGQSDFGLGNPVFAGFLVTPVDGSGSGAESAESGPLLPRTLGDGSPLSSLPPLSNLTPFFAGIGVPGSLVQVEIISAGGASFTQSSYVDASGNWLVSFDQFGNRPLEIRVTYSAGVDGSNPTEGLESSMIFSGAGMASPHVRPGMSIGDIFGAFLEEIRPESESGLDAAIEGR